MAPPPGQNGSALTALQSGSPDGTRVYAGADSLFDLTLSTKPDIVVAATTGLGRLGGHPGRFGRPASTWHWLTRSPSSRASDLLFAAADRSGAAILPVDSEHSAIFQCPRGRGPLACYPRVILTASGGPFRTLPAAAMAKITPEQALAHPTWQMGPKITIDSATLMNKGMEVLEAGVLFGRTLDYVDVVIHPQSIVHSLVEFSDGSVKAQLGYPDMELPIQYALGYPQRLASDFRPLDLAALGQLTFEAPDPVRFPCLALAREGRATGRHRSGRALRRRRGGRPVVPRRPPAIHRYPHGDRSGAATSAPRRRSRASSSCSTSNTGHSSKPTSALGGWPNVRSRAGRRPDAVTS